MKTVQNKITGEIKRITEEEAIKMLPNSVWIFCPKSFWKKQRKPKQK